MTLGHNIKGGNRTQDVKISEDITFETMLLNDSTLQGLKESGFYKPSPIQLHGIPLGKCGFDLLLEAKSGTGKTAVFTVIALEKINLSNGPQVIILAPTREIAAQICDVIKQIGSKYSGLTVAAFMGGLPIKDDIEKLKEQVHIIVGSPGRILHLIKENHIDTSAVRLLVLDEADKLMEKSFRSDINHIFSALPEQKQIIFSSATFPEDSKSFISQYVKVQHHVCPDSNSVLLGVSQRVTVVNHHTNVVRQTQIRFQELLEILSKREFKQCLIFCNYQGRVTELYRMLKKTKWPAEKLYGQQEQLDRLEALKTLQEYKCRILIATDLAARGLDSSHVDLVINFEPPHEWQTYLHRIGRAGRFGSYGLAVTILSKQEEKKFKEILKSLQFQLDVRHYWNDEQFQYDGYQTSETLEQDKTLPECDDVIIEPSMYKDVWDVLTSEETHNLCKIETFDSLCTSFKESKDNVESFGDLLESFQNACIEDSDTSSQSKCLEQSKVIENFVQSMKNTCFANDTTVKPKEYKKPAVEEKVDIGRQEDTDKTDSENISEPDVLPSNKLNNKVKSDSYSCVNTKANGKKKNVKSTPRRSNRSFEKYVSSSDDSYDHGYNTASNDFRKSQCTSANYERVAPLSMNNSRKPNVDSRKGYKNHQLNINEYTRHYINWYNYLKFRTRQIEMAVYINEMSKL